MKSFARQQHAAIEYAAVAWCGVGSSDSGQLESVQRVVDRLIAGVSLSDRLPRNLLLARAGLSPLSVWRDMACCVLAFKLCNTRCVQKLPAHLEAAFQDWTSRIPNSSTTLVLRSSSSGTSRLPRPRTELFRRSPFYKSFTLLNSIPSDNLSSLSSLQNFLLSSEFDS